MKKILIILMSILLTTGCWSRREINDLNFVIGAGVDLADEQLKIVAQVARVDVLAAEGMSGESSTISFTAEGKTVLDTIRNLSLKSQFPLFWGHQQMLVLSKELAEDGVTEVLSFFVRDHETTRHVMLAITDEDLTEFMNKQIGKSGLPMMALHSLIKNYRSNGKLLPVSIHDYLKTNTSKGISIVIPIINTEALDGREVFTVTGMALFAQNVMVGKLTPDQSRGLLFLLDELVSTVIPVNITDKNKAEKDVPYEVSVEVLNAKTKIKAKSKHKFFVTADVDISISEDVFRQDILPKDYDEAIKKIEEATKEQIAKEMQEVVAITKEHKTDPVGFGQAVYRQLPKEWKEIENDWCEEYYPNIEVNYDIKVKFMGQMLQKSLDAN